MSTQSSIQIITGFNLQSSVPIDARIVASGSSDRNAIAWKYDGLRVYDTNDGIPYVWHNGTWSNENSLGGSGTTTYLPIFTSNNVIGNSDIYKLSNNYYISNITSLVTSATISAGKFSGDGNLLTNLNASNITGNISLSNLPNGTNGYILTTNGVSGVFVNPLSLRVGNSDYSANSNVASDSSSSSCNIYFGTQSSGTSALKYNSNLVFKPSTGQLLLNGGNSSVPGLAFGSLLNGIYYNSSSGEAGFTVGGTSVFKLVGGQQQSIDGTVGSPAYSFMSDTTMGIYRVSSNVIGISVVGVDRCHFSAYGLSLTDGYISHSVAYPSLSFIGDYNTGIYKPASNSMGFVTGGVERVRIYDYGMRIGTASNYIKHMISGKITFPVVSGSATINIGSGFTVTMLNYSSNMEARVDFVTSFDSSNLVIHVTAVDSSTTTTVYPISNTSSSFNIRFIGYVSGSVVVHFTVMEIV